MKRLLLITLLLLCNVTVSAGQPNPTDQPLPNVSFDEATLTEFTIVGAGSYICNYNVIVNHVPSGEKYWASGGRWTVIDTKFITATMTWKTLGLEDAPVGGSACLWWYGYTSEGMPHGTDNIDIKSPSTSYLPFIIRW